MKDEQQYKLYEFFQPFLESIDPEMLLMAVFVLAVYILNLRAHERLMNKMCKALIELAKK